MLIKFSTDRAVREVAKALHAAAIAHGFKVLQVRNLQQTMASTGVEFAHECLIFDVCQPQQTKRLLDQDMGASAVLPSRIAIYPEGGATVLATLQPTTLLAMLNTPPPHDEVQRVEDRVVSVLKQAVA